jgi:hypothetical protein
MTTNARWRWSPAVLAAGALLLAACAETGPTAPEATDVPGPSLLNLPTVSDDGLTARDISGVTATDFVTGGTGTASNNVETLSVDVPAGASVEAVYLYWARRIVDPTDAPASEIEVEGSTVTGTIIGGPIDTPDGMNAATSYRADISGLALIGPGSNSLDVEDDAAGALGASVLVLYDDGGAPSVLRLYDGVDFVWNDAALAFAQSADPVTFTVPSSTEERSARLDLFIGDLEGNGAIRPHELDITVGGSTTTLDKPFSAADGPKWDNFTWPITIPAGVTEVTVEPISPDVPDAESLVWVTAGLSVEPPSGGEGCTPGFWRQPHHFDSWVGHAPSDLFGDVFDLPGALDRPEHNTNPASVSLLDALKLKGGGVNALMRHAVAALLNAASGDVSYDLTEAQVISKFNAAIGGGDVEATKDELEAFNEQGCPLN